MAHQATAATVTTKPPRHCPTCGHDLSAYPYYQLRPSPFARRLMNLAGLLIPVMTAVFLVQLFSGTILPNFSMVSGYLILAYICGPSLVIYAASALMPRIRRVTCLHCSWYHDYTFNRGPFDPNLESEATRP